MCEVVDEKTIRCPHCQGEFAVDPMELWHKQRKAAIARIRGDMSLPESVRNAVGIWEWELGDPPAEEIVKRIRRGESW